MNSLQQQLTIDLDHCGGLRHALSKRMDAGGLPLVKDDMLRSPIKLRIEEKLLDSTGDFFHILDVSSFTKKRVYEICGSKTPDSHKVLKDMQGHFLLQMRRSSTPDTPGTPEYIISDPEGKTVLVLAQTEKYHVQAFERNNQNNTSTQTHLLDISRNPGASLFHLNNSAATPIASISRASKSIKRIITGQHSYVASITAGAPALMAFIAVALDEIFAD